MNLFSGRMRTRIQPNMRKHLREDIVAYIVREGYLLCDDTVVGVEVPEEEPAVEGKRRWITT